ncbi:hypothetical protein JR316_0009292 [Psilocybe cubensis]|uniref:Uncharacterized protein n=2 Tax=Psilocybe cubensis TaxID=181762 RepID=A0A8H7XYW7_PSICU|nr:hypothetical protein JR316_0009292 [Psilocybe cubensis]KAH9478830.1 hypothetical protein JR316_0009292 [Psilocybe cubensis]
MDAAKSPSTPAGPAARNSTSTAKSPSIPIGPAARNSISTGPPEIWIQISEEPAGSDFVFPPDLTIHYHSSSEPAIPVDLFALAQQSGLVSNDEDRFARDYLSGDSFVRDGHASVLVGPTNWNNGYGTQGLFQSPQLGSMLGEFGAAYPYSHSITLNAFSSAMSDPYDMRVASQTTISMPQAAARFQRGTSHGTTTQPMFSQQERELKAKIFTFDSEEIPEIGILPLVGADGHNPAQNQRALSEGQAENSRKRKWEDEPLQSGSGSRAPKLSKKAEEECTEEKKAAKTRLSD